jgi:PPK2 family polyphosphate:nucleotide phosphotransferase
MKTLNWLRADGKNFKLKDVPTSGSTDVDGHPIDRETAERLTAENVAALEELQFLLYAEHKHKVLVVLQAMDSGGKDGLIRKVFGPLNPQGVRVQAFKRPTEVELGHDFLWRIHQHTPRNGHIQIFNRSHYEDVLVVRVHNLVPEKQWRRRYEHIRQFEELLAEEGTVVLKFMLHISKEEQRERLQARLDDPTRIWKFEKGDLAERLHWDAYQEAYEDAIRETSTKHAPWYVIPADRKWYRNYAVSAILRATLEELKMQFPAPEEGLDGLVVE